MPTWKGISKPTNTSFYVKLEQVLRVRGRYHALKDMSSRAKRNWRFDKNSNRDICKNMEIIMTKLNNIVQQQLECHQAHQSPSLVRCSSSIRQEDGLRVVREGNMMGNIESENDFEVRKLI